MVSMLKILPKMMILSAHDGASRLLDIVLRIFDDGGALLGMSGPRFGCLLFLILLPAAVVSLLISACISLSQKPENKKNRIAAIVFLCIGVVAVAAFVGLAAYAMIYGTGWAHASR